MVEQFAPRDELISLRSRATAFRPLTVVRELEAEAQKQYFGRIQSLEDELQKTTAKLQELQESARRSRGQSAQILSPEQQAELERFRKTVAETRLALKKCAKTCARTPKPWCSGPSCQHRADALLVAAAAC